MWDYHHHLAITFPETDFADPGCDARGCAGGREVWGVGVVGTERGEGFADGDGTGGEVGGHAGGGVAGGVGARGGVVFDLVVDEVLEAGHAG